MILSDLESAHFFTPGDNKGDNKAIMIGQEGQACHDGKLNGTTI